MGFGVLVPPKQPPLHKELLVSSRWEDSGSSAPLLVKQRDRPQTYQAPSEGSELGKDQVWPVCPSSQL
jgi:hypothetical protein